MYSIEDVKRALARTDFDAQAAQAKMMPGSRPRQRPASISGQPRLGGVLALLYCVDNILTVVLTRRRDDLNSHAGQISFPGGRNDAPESLLTTALRETEEEIGVMRTQIDVLGELTPLYIPPTDYEVHPFVACLLDGKRPFLPPVLLKLLRF